ncbi:MAG: phosphatidylinositol-specific phospholipase C1-like protein [Candidatus Marinimicrobia bacterium]|jgi:hypothetical protein|nr:phosphatidylinositol-specific phospholipase C1-like protein [Candidatus Neomarinimicrobiota bacterium]MDP6568386.1 phosphatidylinositol-specific phospholipase C1-like protein [Candidatus Neomarinimicrobiota bacterium]|tara:strand:- start:192 stop:1361 length:1170 start_codon:yes stop_codon:yes gene_type:complete
MNFPIRFLKTTFFVFVFSIVFFSCKEENASEPDVNSLKLNEIQVIGSHNSYHIAPSVGMLALIGSFMQDLATSIDYTHLPLEEQFTTYGIRQIELDVYPDPEGGLFANRLGNAFLGEPVASGIAALDSPGYKILHFPDVDFETHYITFRDALRTVKQWSEANPLHLPILILVEVKDEGIGDLISILNGFTDPLPIDAAMLDDLDEEIRDVLGEELQKVITPDYVRGERETLEEAVLEDGWPKLGELRGKVIFALDNGGEVRDLYVEGYPSLAGRILFTDSEPGSPEAGFLKMNTPTEEIEQRVLEGYLVRTRADSDTEEARTGETARRDSALSSGAQFISTDYYRPDPRFDESDEWTDYSVQLPGNAIARINPVIGFEEFEGVDLEGGN